jgi:cobalt-precorrin 5A hydrolase
MVSDRDIPRLYPEAYARGIVYRPKSLWLGIGCDRGAPREFLERGILNVLTEFQLSWKSVQGVASIDLKADEPGLLELCKKYGWEFRCYPAETLKSKEGIVSPSETVERHTGTPSVSEAACLEAAGVPQLVVPKQKYKEADVRQAMTVSIARKSFALRRPQGERT